MKPGTLWTNLSVSAIVDRLAKLLGLSVSVRSVPGRGSVLAVEAPPAHAAHDTETVLSQLLAPARFEGLPVLLIDDDPAALEAIEGLLVQWGCVVSSAGSAADAARRVVGAPPPQLIICDYHLGGTELGTAVIQRVRELTDHAIPALILSADASSELRLATTLAGLHLLHKPLNVARLRALMLHIAARRTADA